MPLLKELWPVDVMVLLATTLSMAIPAYRLKLDGRLRRGIITLAVISYAVCATTAVGHLYLAHWMESIAKVERTRTTPAVLAEGWGANFGKDKRTEYSEMLARQTYTDWGEIAEYFDLEGQRRPFSPTQVDQENRRLHVAYLDGLDRAVSAFFILGLVWLAVPLLGILIGLAPWGQSFMRALTSLFKAGRPPAAPGTQS
jgi:hypothetical protein